MSPITSCEMSATTAIVGLYAVDPAGREVVQLLCDLVASFDVPVESTPDLASPETLARGCICR